ncbi:hypothetical protein DMJ13_02645 [halophilic archaeon]|nr:hypothetical protein DMJ13_02645 [halophilic archaeon]
MDDESVEGSGSSRSRRRTLLKSVGVGGVTALAGCSSPTGDEQNQGGSTTKEDTGTKSQPKEFHLNGLTSGWIGQQPKSIAETVNPTLSLEPGRQYEIVWTNKDGAPHNVVIENDAGDKLVESKIVQKQGKTQTVTFTAKKEMTQYYCAVHPSSMRGDLQFGKGGGKEEEEKRAVPKGESVGVESIADGFTYPISMKYAQENRDRRFIVDQTGQISVHGPNGLREEPFLNVTDQMVNLQSYYDGGFQPGALKMDERGLLGLAFHPNFSQNRKFYVHYSVPPKNANVDVPKKWDHAQRFSEFEATQDFSTADPESERVLLEIPHPQFNHNAGPILFGPDGYLYMTMGDGGGANDTYLGHVDDWYDGNAGGNGQDVTDNLLGTILRIDVDSRDGDKPYGVPDDNPFVGKEGKDEIFAWGLRNPWRATFNDGTLYVADVGQSLYEEVNTIEKGGNYGWNVKEGTVCFNASKASKPAGNCPQKSPRGNELKDPVLQYQHTKDGTSIGVAIVGGYVYDNDAVSGLKGKYVFGDWTSDPTFREPAGRLFAAPVQGDEKMGKMKELTVPGQEGGTLGRYVNAFARDSDGELYVLTTKRAVPEGNTGEVLKIVPPKEGSETTTGESTTTGTTTGDDTTSTTTGGNTTTAGGNAEN